MADQEYLKESYVKALNAWHLELAIVQEVVAHLLAEGDGPEWWGAAGHIVSGRFRDLVEACPFPGSGEVGQAAEGQAAELH